jgi:putative ubiquitin-RnfH superfamily antitoxin RatB of RatAB toxin-antitoxin module
MASMKVLISFATPSEQREVSLEVPQDSSVRSILGFFADELSRLGFDIEASPVGIWGKVCTRDTIAKEGDRIEVYRPLETDPKEARRARAKRGGA